MGKTEKEYLNSALNSYLNSIHETLQIFDQTPPSSLEKVRWDDVIQMGEQISKEATIAGILWSGETQEVNKLEENMASYFNTLQGFLLLSHGSTVGAGPTLTSNIHAVVKQVVDCSFKLWKESVSSYASFNKDRKLSIPQLVGTVWEACSAIKKTPGTNITAIGLAITQVTVSIKDVLREMNELKPAITLTDETLTEFEDDTCDNDSCMDNDDDLGDDLSPKEMKIAQSAITVVSKTLVVVKELIRSITGLLKQESSENINLAKSLERLLKHCQGIGAQIDEVGACLYPPQEAASIKIALEKISSYISELKVEIESIKGTSEAFFQAYNSLKSSLRHLEFELGYSSSDDPVPKIQNLAVSI